jgi:hypothetical protein
LYGVGEGKLSLFTIFFKDSSSKESSGTLNKQKKAGASMENI